jgi:Domain of unknown function (DUF4157)
VSERERVGHRPRVQAQTHDVQATTLERGGKKLDSRCQDRLQALSGASFADVRIHDDPESHRAAHDLDARAFTAGRHVHFAAGEYRPGETDGLHLLAHELAHTVQQQTTPAAPEQIRASEPDTRGALEHEADRAADAVVAGRQNALSAVSAGAVSGHVQRKPRKKGAAAPKKLGDPNVPVDVVLLMDDQLTAYAQTVAPGGLILKVTSVEEMTRELKRVQAPFKSLFIVSHSLSSGDLGFQQGESITYVRPENVADALRNVIPSDRAPAVVDFRGCSLGETPGAMDQIRVAAGAQAAIGANCFMIQQANGPISLRGKDILKRSDIRTGDEESFQQGLKKLRESFGPKKEKCIIDPSEAAYFRAKGRLVALWLNDSLSTDFEERTSRCYSALTPEVVPASEAAKKTFEPMTAGDCKVIRVEGGTPTTSTTPKPAPEPEGRP